MKRLFLWLNNLQYGVFLALTSIYGWHLSQLGLDNAFLNGDLEETIYMDLPQRYVVKEESSSKSKLVCKLQKSLYGLKQASR